MRIFLCILFLIPLSLTAGEHLPLSKTFKGQAKFQSIARKAVKEQWWKLPISDRMVKVAKELEGIPYKSYTLEIDNHIESPSVNFEGMDCWTFFETCMCFCRMLKRPKQQHGHQEHARHRRLQHLPMPMTIDLAHDRVVPDVLPD